MNKYTKLIKEAMNELKNKETRYKQIPNLLTASRLLSPLFIIPSALTGNLILTAVLTGIFGITDLFDGIIARKLHIESELGLLLDAFTDKIFSGTLLIAMSFTNPILIVNILLEIVIANINISREKKGKDVKPSIIGKIKTWSLFLLVGASILNPALNITKVVNVLLASTTIMQVLTVLTYINKNIDSSGIDSNLNKDLIDKELEIELSPKEDKKLELTKELDITSSAKKDTNQDKLIDDYLIEIDHQENDIIDLGKGKTLELKK